MRCSAQGEKSAALHQCPLTLSQATLFLAHFFATSNQLFFIQWVDLFASAYPEQRHKCNSEQLNRSRQDQIAKMRYYEKVLPDTDEVVMCQVRQIAEMGAYVHLLEYDNAEGMILLSELSRRRIRSIQKLIRVGRNEVVVVLRVDKEKGEQAVRRKELGAQLTC